MALVGTTTRALLLLAGGVAAAVGAWALAAAPLLRVADPLLADGPGALPRLDLPTVLAGGCAAALLACTGWLVATGALLVLARLGRLLAPGSPAWARLAETATRACPAVARGAVTALLGVAVGAAASTPARADVGGQVPGAAGLTGLALPDRATGAAPAAGARATGTGPVLVRPGDSLWSIAEGLLPAGAPDPAVDAGWRALHAANRGRIGPDPDLLRPGTRLVVPDLLTHAPHGEELP
ncbi:LysM peptidoglycan-binding domain-containing protein [Nocardioides panacis]|uniref:LysM peptidoglycan-binding domain-containing protein n=1 Tax=Nocardioides panacis TaxID=2849501 RepID=A0A975XYT8_9ACTN|nr:LysM domain-containing protein [Nocardioides panacis]QWZ06741.1 LysM peptidoglycan-binding domain-containing protein [Nocardioides panacis]